MVQQTLSEQAESIEEDQLKDVLDFIKEVHLAISTNFPTDPGDDDKDMLQISYETTSRTSIRVPDEHKSLAGRYNGMPYTANKELFYAFCVEFARYHEEKFANFLTEYVEKDIRGELVSSASNVPNVDEIKENVQDQTDAEEDQEEEDYDNPEI